MSSHIIVHQFLKNSMRKWKFLKDHPNLPWKFSRCADCAIPLFSSDFCRCVICHEIWMTDKKEREESTKRCLNCGDDAEDGPCQAFCSRWCLRDWSRD